MKILEGENLTEEAIGCECYHDQTEASIKMKSGEVIGVYLTRENGTVTFEYCDEDGSYCITEILDDIESISI